MNNANIFTGIFEFLGKVFKRNEEIVNPSELGTSNKELDTMIKEYYLN